MTPNSLSFPWDYFQIYTSPKETLWLPLVDVTIECKLELHPNPWSPLFLTQWIITQYKVHFLTYVLIFLFMLDDGIITSVLCIIFKLVNYEHIEEVAIFWIIYISFVSVCVFTLSSIIEVGLFYKKMVCTTRELDASWHLVEP